MKKVMMSVICLCMIFLLGATVFENSYATNNDQEVVLTPTPVKDNTVIIEASNTDTAQVCPYNHENCDGIHKNEDCPNNHENYNVNCLKQQNIQINKTDSTQACPNNHENCDGPHQKNQCDNTRKHRNSSNKGQHHRNSN